MVTRPDKRQLRARLKRARAELSAELREAASQRICAHIAASDAFGSADHVALYLAQGAEVDLSALAQLARARGKTLALPRLTQPGRMQFHLWQPTDPLTKNRYGIGEPTADAAILPVDELDVVAMPGVGFDRTGGRLGMGQGYYDRALAPAPTARQRGPVRIGVAFDVQVVAQVPTESHDLPMDAIATETGLWLVTR